MKNVISMLSRAVFLPLKKISGTGHRKFRIDYAGGDWSLCSYRMSHDGARIYDGPYRYENNGGQKQYFCGNFKDDMQVGKWICEVYNSQPFPKTLLKTVIEINYNDEGLPHGKFRITEFYRNKKSRDVVCANFYNGWLDGLYRENNRYTDGRREEVSGQYKRDRRSGIWHYPDFTADYDNCDINGYPFVKFKGEKDGRSGGEHAFIRRSEFRLLKGALKGIEDALEHRRIKDVVTGLSMKYSRIAEIEMDVCFGVGQGVLPAGFGEFDDVPVEVRCVRTVDAAGKEALFQQASDGDVRVSCLLCPDGTVSDIVAYEAGRNTCLAAEKLISELKWEPLSDDARGVYAHCELTVGVPQVMLKR